MQMHPMFSVLQAIFFMSSNDLPITRSTLARLPFGEAELGRQLVALDRAGFVDARRLRLTLPGLAAAVAMRTTKASPARVTRVAA